MKIVLTQSHKSWRFSVNPLVFPNGMLYCAAALEKAGFEVHIVDPLPRDLSLEQTIESIKSYSPDIVGVYFTTDSRFRGFELLKALKNKLNVITMSGGPHSTLCPENTLVNNPELDIIIIGEAEYSLVKVVERLKSKEFDLTGIPNVAFRQGKNIIINPERYFIPDLDSIPLPSYHLIPDFSIYDYYRYYNGEKRQAMNVFAGRGCPYGCIFCASSQIWKRTSRFVSIDKVMDQIKYLYDKYGVKHIGFFDETFNIKKDRIIELCEKIMSSDLDISWDCEIRADAVDRDLLQIMKDSRCTYTCFGIESADEYIRNKVIGKNISNDKIIEVDRIAHEIGLDCEVNLMISFPNETYQMAEKTFKLVDTLYSRCHIQPTRIYPGTALEKIAKDKKIIPDDFDWSDPKGHKKHSPYYIPGMLGDYPMYLEKLDPVFIFEKLFSLTSSDRWGMDKDKFPLYLLVKKALSEINYYRDFLMLFYAAVGLIKSRFKKWFKF